MPVQDPQGYLTEEGAQSVREVLAEEFGLLSKGDFDFGKMESRQKIADHQEVLGNTLEHTANLSNSISELGLTDSNPHSLGVDALTAYLSSGRDPKILDQMKAKHPNIEDEMVKAQAYDEDQTRKARKVGEAAQLADTSQNNEEYLHLQALRLFDARFWSLSPDQRREEAQELGINIEDYEPSQHPYGSRTLDPEDDQTIHFSETAEK